MKNYFILGLLLISTNSHAAVPTQVAEVSPENFSAQIAVAKNAALPMGARWAALLKAGELASAEEVDQIRTFSTNKEWYMRNAAMVALSKLNTEYAVDEAKKLVKDKALVVRSAAVDMLATKYTLENRNILADELSKKYNFKGKQSLWIRPQIMKHLATRASSDDRAFFARYLFDQDDSIGEMAAMTLEKITDVRFTGKNQLAQWKSHVKAKGWL